VHQVGFIDTSIFRCMIKKKHKIQSELFPLVSFWFLKMLTCLLIVVLLFLWKPLFYTYVGTTTNWM